MDIAATDVRSTVESSASNFFFRDVFCDPLAYVFIEIRGERIAMVDSKAGQINCRGVVVPLCDSVLDQISRAIQPRTSASALRLVVVRCHAGVERLHLGN